MSQPAAVVAAPGEDVTVVDDVTVDQPRASEALIEISAAGVCGTDLSLQTGRMPFPMPLLLGHEAAGRVAALGPDTGGPAVGTRVTLWMRPPCRSCRACLRGDAGLCAASGAMSARGTLLDGRTSFSRGGQRLYRALGIGAFTTRVVMPVAGLVPVPDDVADDVAALLGCGVATGAGAVLNVARPRPGDVVLILGGGGVGLSAAMAAAAVGAGAVVVADPAPQRRQAALDLGATHAIEGGDREAVRSQVSEVLGDPTVDVALDAVGRSELVELAFRTVRQGGTVVAVGVQAGGATVTLPGPVLTLSHKRVLGCYMGGVDPQRDLPILFDLHRRGRFPVDRLIGARRPLAEVPDALDDLAAARGLRTVIQVQR
jgi:Zn-dependent alcohol dehydrogenase